MEIWIIIGVLVLAVIFLIWLAGRLDTRGSRSNRSGSGSGGSAWYVDGSWFDGGSDGGGCDGGGGAD